MLCVEYILFGPMVFFIHYLSSSIIFLQYKLTLTPNKFKLSLNTFVTFTLWKSKLYYTKFLQVWKLGTLGSDLCHTQRTKCDFKAGCENRIN